MEIARSGSRKKKLVRGDPVVRRVLEATLQEMAQVGYRSLRMEDVAARAKVNKTTVYRRWPTKKDLVRTAMLKLMESKMAALEALPDTGSLREDLLAASRLGIRTMQTPATQSLLRVAVSELADPELIAIGKSIQTQRRAMFHGLFERAKARGELSDTQSMTLVLDLLRGVLIGKIYIDHEPPDEEYLRRVVDLLLHGALRARTKSRPW
jgi:AcrR family transcriptional regulator